MISGNPLGDFYHPDDPGDPEDPDGLDDPIEGSEEHIDELIDDALYGDEGP